MRLIEIAVVGCHQIAAYIFELDDGAHKRQVHQDWLQSPAAHKWREIRGRAPPPGAFFHRYYLAPEQYPRSLADVAGYWAEGKIFGGVVLFDRGETETEVREHYSPNIIRRGC